MRLAAAGLVLATAFACAAGAWWVFDLFVHFRVQYAVASAALGLVALATAARRTSAVFLIIAVLNGWAIKNIILEPRSAEQIAGGRTLRVASANVLVTNPTPERVVEFVYGTRADLVVLVEAQTERWRDTLMSIAERYPYRAPEEWRDGAPVVLFSRLPITESSAVEARQGRSPYLLAKIDVDGSSLAVVGVHPQSPSPTDPAESRERNRQLDGLSDVVGNTEGPVVLAGDFNVSPWSPHFRELLEESGLRNAAAGQGWIATWPTWFWPALVPIDHILVGGLIDVLRVIRGPSTGSDHFPIVADLVLAPK